MAGQVVRLICPNLLCRTILSVPVKARGKDVRCRACGTRVHIPEKPRPPKSPIENAAPGKPETDETVES